MGLYRADAAPSPPRSHGERASPGRRLGVGLASAPPIPAPSLCFSLTTRRHPAPPPTPTITPTVMRPGMPFLSGECWAAPMAQYGLFPGTPRRCRRP